MATQEAIPATTAPDDPMPEAPPAPKPTADTTPSTPIGRTHWGESFGFSRQDADRYIERKCQPYKLPAEAAASADTNNPRAEAPNNQGAPPGPANPTTDPVQPDGDIAKKEAEMVAPAQQGARPNAPRGLPVFKYEVRDLGDYTPELASDWTQTKQAKRCIDCKQIAFAEKDVKCRQCGDLTRRTVWEWIEVKYVHIKPPAVKGQPFIRDEIPIRPVAKKN